MPAYIVLEEDENTGGVIFAKDKRAALRIGANEFADGEVEYCNITRRRDLDKYEGGGVPVWLLVSQGWFFECDGCGMKINDCTMDDDRLPITGIIGFDRGPVYCCHACRMIHLAEKAAIKAFGDAYLDMMRDMVKTRFGDVEFASGEKSRDHVYVRPWGEHFIVREAIVSFNFPDQKLGPASLEIREARHNQGWEIKGPPNRYYTCCAGDKQAFEAWADSIKGKA